MQQRTSKREKRTNSNDRKNNYNKSQEQSPDTRKKFQQSKFSSTMVVQSNKVFKQRSKTTVQSGAQKKGNLFLCDDNIEDNTMSEIPKTQWLEGKKCYICSQTFKKLKGVNEHHCRYCGKAVCGYCSSKSINKVRACDLCIYKKMNRKQELRRKEYLKTLSQKVKDLKEKIKQQQELLQNKKKEIEDFTQDKEEEEEDKKQQIIQLQKELKKATRILQKRKETSKNLKKVYIQEKSLVDEKDKEIQQLQQKINTLTLEIEHKKEHYNSKLQEWKDLLIQKEQLENSDSFQQMTGQQFENDSNQFVTDNEQFSFSKKGHIEETLEQNDD